MATAASMRRWWLGVLVALVSAATPPTLCQSGDGGSGFGADAPARSDPASGETCAVRFGARGLAEALGEEVARLRAVRRAAGAAAEDLLRRVGAELGERSYADAIRADVAAVRLEHDSCRDAAERAERDLDRRLRGEPAGMRGIREASAAFEDTLRAAADVARRLESSSRALQSSFTNRIQIQV